ncbi:bifunctional riboflavin kinase/FAD synthetase [Burkholderiaceae bacterium DAT-1]|nr:bifunctional riboflavin kinase/FAD synthetase [Burkholderiaceae bacterium DAT-1]
MQVFRGAPFSAAGACALTIGNFDGLHLGHQAMLARLRAEAQARGLPTAVLTFEPHPRELFTPDTAPARLTSLREKLELLRDAGIDRVYVAHFNRGFAGLDAERFAATIIREQIGAEYVLVGDDFRFGKARTGDIDALTRFGQQFGFHAEHLPEIALYGTRASSTSVRDMLASGRIEDAADMLGRPYSISGRVIHGNKLGREIGFPTANIQIKHNRPPLQGIYVTVVHGAAETPLMGAASLGSKPTVDSSGKLSLEVFLLDFSGDLYGKHLRIDFLHKLRDEVKYTGLDPLIRQIHQDVADTRQYFAHHAEALQTRISIPRP